MSAPVLVVDDDLDSRALLATLLTLRGYAVVTASDGAEGLVVARRHRPSLILLDLMMPVMGGEEFRTEQLKDPVLASIPVIVISAKHDVAKVAVAMAVTSCVQKPIHFDQLMASVDAVVLGG